MTENSMKAVEYHKSGFSCSAAVLNAFRDEIFMDEIQALSAAAPMAGGRMIKCGAVLAAEYVIRNKYDGETAERKISEFEKEFASLNQSLVCKELKGAGTGKVLRSCRGCVSDSAEILERLIKTEFKSE
ncbi:MAG: C_GCAxxG_C_C family protein [Ruminococcus sp.]|nr:C_GCAxxG_C_C family protein [Ruminococcus sp.]